MWPTSAHALRRCLLGGDSVHACQNRSQAALVPGMTRGTRSGARGLKFQHAVLERSQSQRHDVTQVILIYAPGLARPLSG